MEELKRLLTATEQANGLANRFLWFCVARSRPLPFGGSVDEKALDLLAQELGFAIDYAQNIGRVDFSEDARDLWFEVYDELSEARPGLFGAITARAEAQVLRLALVYAVLDGSAQIAVQHLKAALEVWRYCAQSARYIFGCSLGDPAADEILRLLKDSQCGLTRTELSKHFGNHKSSDEITRALMELKSLGLVEAERTNTAGRPAETWRAVAGREKAALDRRSQIPNSLNSLSSRTTDQKEEPDHADWEEKL